MEFNLLTSENKFLTITSGVSGPEEWQPKKEITNNWLKQPLKSVLKLELLKLFKESISDWKIKMRLSERWSWNPFRNSLKLKTVHKSVMLQNNSEINLWIVFLLHSINKQLMIPQF